MPIVSEQLSDSGSFDEALELLTLSGRSLPHAIDDDGARGVGERPRT